MPVTTEQVDSITTGLSAKEYAVEVIADFDIEVESGDLSIPVRVNLINKTFGADDYLWTLEGADIESSTDETPPSITYSRAGVYSILLECTNIDGSTDSKEQSITIYDAVATNFSVDIIESSYPPVEVALTNLSVGADSYLWSFEGSETASSIERTPANPIFSDPGVYTIILESSNDFESFISTREIEVLPHLAAEFSYTVSDADFDMEVPVTITLHNNSISATDYLWEFSDQLAELSTGSSTGLSASSSASSSTGSFTDSFTNSSTDSEPTVTFYTAGVQTITLTASNGKESSSLSQEITLLPNRNLITLEDIHLGINTAHKEGAVGSFISTRERKVYRASDINESNSHLVDLIFFGLNDSFIYNIFISPDRAEEFAFKSLLGATNTKIINLQESSDNTDILTVAEFNSIEDDTILQDLVIEETSSNSQDFDSSVAPRIVLFETEDGRKGAIKIKEFVADSESSYIIADLKVMKESQRE